MIIICSLCFSLIAFKGATEPIDSLKNLIAKAKSDTARITCQKALVLQYFLAGAYEEALAENERMFKLSEEIGSKDGMKAGYLYSGLINYSRSDFPKALDYYRKGLKLAESTHDVQKIASFNANIGIVYFMEESDEIALEYFKKAVEIYGKLKDNEGLSSCYANTGMIYHRQNKFKEALEYYFYGLGTYEKEKNPFYTGNVLSNIGTVYKDMNNYDSALKYFNKALEISRRHRSNTGIETSYINLGELYALTNKYEDALRYYKMGLELAIEMQNTEHQLHAYSGLSRACEKIGNFKDAYFYHVKYEACKDSIYGFDKSQQIADLKAEMEVEKRETELAAEQKIKDAVVDEEKKRQKLFLGAVGAVAFILMVLAIVIYRNLQTNKKKNRIISEQKKLVEDKQKDIIDSIKYAKRIQSSLLPTDKFVEKEINRLSRE